MKKKNKGEKCKIAQKIEKQEKRKGRKEEDAKSKK